MTVWINPIAEESESEVQSDGRIINIYSRTYQYRTDSMVRPTELDIYADIGINPGSPYSNDSNATCNKAKIGPGPEMTIPPKLCYHVTFGWATNAPLPNAVSSDPTTKRTQWSIKPTIQSRYITRDGAGQLIVNTAGQPFDGGIPVDVRLGTVIARRTVTGAGYNKAAVLANSGKVNSAVFLGGAIGTVQVDIDSEERFEGAYNFWDEVYTFTYDPLGMQPKVPSAGFYQRSAIGSNVLKRIQQDGEDVQEPEPLDANGILVPIGSRPASCAIQTVTYYGVMDFNSFGL